MLHRCDYSWKYYKLINVSESFKKNHKTVCQSNFPHVISQLLKQILWAQILEQSEAMLELKILEI